MTRVTSQESLIYGRPWLYFVERVLRESAEEWERKSILRQRGENLPRLLEKIAVRFGLDTEDLKSGSRARTVAKARAVLCYLGVRRLGVSSANISKELGISPSAVSKAIMRGKKELEPDDIELVESQ